MSKLLDTQLLIGGLVGFYQAIFARKNKLSVTNFPRIEHQGKVAHIFGSGASAIDTKVLLNRDTHAFGCNLTLGLLPSWHVGFIERLENDPFGKQQMEILMDREFSALILKNNYPLKENKTEKNIQLLQTKHRNLSVLKECQIIGKRDNLDRILKYVLDEKTEVITQYASSILTMIVYAIKCGYRNIVLHGVDHGGACFYDYEPFKKYKFGVTKRIDMQHQTDGYTVPFSSVLEQSIIRLASVGITIKYAKELL